MVVAEGHHVLRTSVVEKIAATHAVRVARDAHARANRVFQELRTGLWRRVEHVFAVRERLVAPPATALFIDLLVEWLRYHAVAVPKVQRDFHTTPARVRRTGIDLVPRAVVANSEAAEVVWREMLVAGSLVGQDLESDSRDEHARVGLARKVKLIVRQLRVQLEKLDV